MSKDQMTDNDLDRLLALASTPDLPPGSAGRLLAKIGEAQAGASASNVVQFRPRQNREAGRPFARSWLAAVPLAASLAFGIWIGAMGAGASWFPSTGTSTDEIQASELTSGVDDVENITEDSKS